MPPVTPIPPNAIRPPISLATARYYQAILSANVIPTNHKKKPLTPWTVWTAAPQTDADLAALPWSRADGIAVIVGERSGALCVIDFDKQPDRTALDAFLTALGLSPDYSWIVQTPGGGYHVHVRVPGLVAPDDSKGGRVDRDGIHGGHIELRHEALLVMLPPSRHPKGGRYAFVNGVPAGPPFEVDGSALLAAYDAITVQPEPKPQSPVRNDYQPLDTGSDPDERREVERRTRLEIARVLEKRGHKDGYFCCPQDHGPEGKDFLFGVELDTPIGGCQGKHSGELTRWKDLAAFLGINVTQIAREVAAERRQAAVVRKRSLPVSPLPQSEMRYFRYGLPKALVCGTDDQPYNIGLQVHLNKWYHASKGDIPNAGPFWRGLFVITELAVAGLINPAQWTIKEIAEKNTRGLDYTAVRRFRQHLFAEFVLYETEPLIGTDMQINRGRPETTYALRPVGEFLERYLRYLSERSVRALWFHKYPHLPIEVLALEAHLVVYGAMPDDIGRLDDLSQPLYEEHAEEIATASQEHYRRRAYHRQVYGPQAWEGDYEPLTFPEEVQLANAAAFRDAIHDQEMERMGGVCENRYALAARTGRTLASHRAAAEKKGILAIPVFVEYPVPIAGHILSQAASLDTVALERRQIMLRAPDGSDTTLSPAGDRDYETWLAAHGGREGALFRVWTRTIDKRDEGDLISDAERADRELLRRRQQSASRRRQPKDFDEGEPQNKFDRWLVDQAVMRDGPCETVILTDMEPEAAWAKLISAARSLPVAALPWAAHPMEQEPDPDEFTQLDAMLVMAEPVEGAVPLSAVDALRETAVVGMEVD